MVEILRGNDSTARSLVNQQDESIDESKVMFKTFQEHFGLLFVVSEGPDSKLDFTDFLAELPCILGRDVKSCEGSITPDVVIEAMVDCVRCWILMF